MRKHSHESRAIYVALLSVLSNTPPPGPDTTPTPVPAAGSKQSWELAAGWALALALIWLADDLTVAGADWGPPIHQTIRFVPKSLSSEP